MDIKRQIDLKRNKNFSEKTPTGQNVTFSMGHS